MTDDEICDYCEELITEKPVRFGDGIYCTTFCMEAGNEWREEAS